MSTAITGVRVTSWNDGQPSQTKAGSATGFLGGTSYWTHMVDDTKYAYTGVELWTQTGRSPGGMYTEQQSLGWFWGPCY